MLADVLRLARLARQREVVPEETRLAQSEALAVHVDEETAAHVDLTLPQLPDVRSQVEQSRHAIDGAQVHVGEPVAQHGPIARSDVFEAVAAVEGDGRLEGLRHGQKAPPVRRDLGRQRLDAAPVEEGAVRVAHGRDRRVVGVDDGELHAVGQGAGKVDELLEDHVELGVAVELSQSLGGLLEEQVERLVRVGASVFRPIHGDGKHVLAAHVAHRVDAGREDVTAARIGRHVFIRDHHYPVLGVVFVSQVFEHGALHLNSARSARESSCQLRYLLGDILLTSAGPRLFGESPLDGGV